MYVDQVVNDDLKKTIITAMKTHTASVELQTLACNVLGNATVIGMTANTYKQMYYIRMLQHSNLICNI